MRVWRERVEQRSGAPSGRPVEVGFTEGQQEGRAGRAEGTAGAKLHVSKTKGSLGHSECLDRQIRSQVSPGTADGGLSV